jgi:hypothetical protein
MALIGKAVAGGAPRIPGRVQMLQTVFVVVFTALLSALATWAVAYVWFRARLQAQVQQELAKAQDEFEARVKRGVLAAGEELLPAFRHEVAEGFRDAVRSSPTAVVEDTARVVSRGADLLEKGLGTLFGVKPPKR